MVSIVVIAPIALLSALLLMHTVERWLDADPTEPRPSDVDP